MIKKRLPVITKKLLVTIISAGFLLCAAVFSASYWSFSTRFKAQYDSTIRSIGAAARQTLNPDDFEKYLSTKTKDEKFYSVISILQDFVDKFDLNLLYVSSVLPPDYTHIRYIYNAVNKNNKWEPFYLGYEEDYFEPNYNASTKRVFEKGETIVRHTMKTRSGSHITAQLPVRDSSGKIIAVIGVQKSTQEFVDARRSFIVFLILLELFFAVIFSLLFSIYFNGHFIKPIVLVTHEADHFASYGGKPSDSLLAIKNHDEIGTLAHTVHQMEHDVCRNMEELTKVTAEKERISTELSLAAKIQLEMLPKGYPPFPEHTEFDLYATMTPAKEVGGDLYDYLMLDNDHLLLVVGDVSGKGVSAALFMAKCKELLDVYANLSLTPKEIFEKTNEQLCVGNDTGLFVTCWLGIFTLSTGELCFVNAGHPYPVLYKKSDDSFSFLKEKPNIILAAMEGIPYKEHRTTLHKGDRLFIYTDGVTEATDINEKLFGDERLLHTMQKTRNLDAPKILETIRADIDAFTGEAEQFDDITMMSFEWRG